MSKILDITCLPREPKHYLFVGSRWKHRVRRGLEWKRRLFIQVLWNPYFSRRKPVFIRRTHVKKWWVIRKKERLFGQNPSFSQKHHVSWLGCSFQQFYVDQQMIPRVLDSSDILLPDPRHDKDRCQRLGTGLDSWWSFASFATGIVGWNLKFGSTLFKLYVFLWSIWIHVIYVSFS